MFSTRILHGIIPASKMARIEKQHICYSFFRYVLSGFYLETVAMPFDSTRKEWRAKKGIRKIHHSYRDNTKEDTFIRFPAAAAAFICIGYFSCSF